MNHQRASERPERSPVVLVVGAINTDLVARSLVAPGPGETVTGHDFAIFGGGKGANQAFAVARSGVATAMLGAVGSDDFGRARLADLTAEGIDVSHVATRSDIASGVALIMVDDSGENRILYVPGPTLTISVGDVERAMAAAKPDLILMTLEPPVEVLERLLLLADRSHVPVILNATPEPDAGRALAARVRVLIVNETEACQLLGIELGREAWPEVVRRLLATGPETVVATLGEEGAIVGSGDRIETFPAPSVEVIDTTGAGDAFCGAFVARLARGDDPFAAARYGVAAGSLAVTIAGAQPSIPRGEEIQIVLDSLLDENE